MERNLPATRDEATPVPVEAAPIGRRRPLSVAFLPFALIVFIVLALSIAAWTFLAAAPAP
jgi:hypothetical protein